MIEPYTATPSFPFVCVSGKTLLPALGVRIQWNLPLATTQNTKI